MTVEVTRHEIAIEKIRAACIFQNIPKIRRGTGSEKSFQRSETHFPGLTQMCIGQASRND